MYVVFSNAPALHAESEGSRAAGLASPRAEVRPPVHAVRALAAAPSLGLPPSAPAQPSLALPPPPPAAPLLPPGVHGVVDNATQLFALVDATPRGSNLSLSVPAGTRLQLGGRRLIVNPGIGLAVEGSGGSQMDGEGWAGLFKVSTGASLVLRRLELVGAGVQLGDYSPVT